MLPNLQDWQHLRAPRRTLARSNIQLVAIPLYFRQVQVDQLFLLVVLPESADSRPPSARYLWWKVTVWFFVDGSDSNEN